MSKSFGLIQKVPDRPGHDRRYCLNSKKLQSIGWKPQFSFERALKETVVWYDANTAWWKKIKNKPSFRSYYLRQYAKRMKYGSATL